MAQGRLGTDWKQASLAKLPHCTVFCTPARNPISYSSASLSAAANRSQP